MKPTTNLARLRRSVIRRTRLLRDFFIHSKAAPHRERNAAAAFCVLELDNTIINLHREFLISSLHVECRTCSGHKVTHNNNFPTPDSAALYIMSVLEPMRFNNRYSAATSLTRREETKVRDPLKLQNVSAASMMSNAGSIITALSLNSPAFSQMATYRNFFAHRNVETARKLKNLSASIGLAPAVHEWDAISQLLPGSPTSLFESWAFDVELFAEFLLD
ncbi:hypothetical protein U8607_18470 [Methylobacterium durans]|uniref:hypothetical protein n=1 Tax=Methylobacterium durans TaxID=2202825 RepID=UPI002AFDEB08|nr:hypothetical protein [Methylobacterium durans]MEA1834078.1 hypothetical protein [Methylobacterium durans]